MRTDKDWADKEWLHERPRGIFRAVLLGTLLYFSLLALGIAMSRGYFG